MRPSEGTFTGALYRLAGLDETLRLAFRGREICEQNGS